MNNLQKKLTQTLKSNSLFKKIYCFSDNCKEQRSSKRKIDIFFNVISYIFIVGLILSTFTVSLLLLEENQKYNLVTPAIIIALISIIIIARVFRLKKLFLDAQIILLFFFLAKFIGYIFLINTSNDDFLVEKPIIYLYPENETEVTVQVGNPQNLLHTYPQYPEAGWKVIAQPNGDLNDPQTNRFYYALYWEGKNTIKPNLTEGFVVKGSDTIPFLEEKLSYLGLNEREANEFIIYWLPKLESSSYNFIRFQTMQEQNQNMPLAISPNPDTLIRVMMEFKNLSSPIEVKEQILPPTPNREGFVAVEWGGTDVTTNRLQ